MPTATGWAILRDYAVRLVLRAYPVRAARWGYPVNQVSEACKVQLVSEVPLAQEAQRDHRALGV